MFSRAAVSIALYLQACKNFASLTGDSVSASDSSLSSRSSLTFDSVSDSPSETEESSVKADSEGDQDHPLQANLSGQSNTAAQSDVPAVMHTSSLSSSSQVRCSTLHWAVTLPYNASSMLVQCLQSFLGYVWSFGSTESVICRSTMLHMISLHTLSPQIGNASHTLPAKAWLGLAVAPLI